MSKFSLFSQTFKTGGIAQNRLRTKKKTAKSDGFLLFSAILSRATFRI